MYARSKLISLKELWGGLLIFLASKTISGPRASREVSRGTSGIMNKSTPYCLQSIFLRLS